MYARNMDLDNYSSVKNNSLYTIPFAGLTGNKYLKMSNHKESIWQEKFVKPAMTHLTENTVKND